MSSIESITESLEKLLETAKDMPAEKIAIVGLIVLGTLSVVKDMAKIEGGDTIEHDHTES